MSEWLLWLIIMGGVFAVLAVLAAVQSCWKEVFIGSSIRTEGHVTHVLAMGTDRGEYTDAPYAQIQYYYCVEGKQIFWIDKVHGELTNKKEGDQVTDLLSAGQSLKTYLGALNGALRATLNPHSPPAARLQHR